MKLTDLLTESRHTDDILALYDHEFDSYQAILASEGLKSAADEIATELSSKHLYDFLETTQNFVDVINIENKTWFITDNGVIDPEFGDMEEPDEWINRFDVDDLAIFYNYDERQESKEFWQGVSRGSYVWHNTGEREYEDIMESGYLEAMNKTRGLTNRSTGNAVFVTTDPDEAAYGSYGPVTLRIDLYAMKRANYTPLVTEEEPLIEKRLREALAHYIGVEDYNWDEADFDGLSPYTLIIHDDIPVQFLERDD